MIGMISLQPGRIKSVETYLLSGIQCNGADSDVREDRRSTVIKPLDSAFLAAMASRPFGGLYYLLAQCAKVSRRACPMKRSSTYIYTCVNEKCGIQSHKCQD